MQKLLQYLPAHNEENSKKTTLALLGTAGAVYSTYMFVKWIKQKNYFQTIGIKPGPTPVPVFGNLITFMKKGMIGFDTYLSTFGRVVGFYEGAKPCIMCTDPLLLKNILIKDFYTFRNRSPIGNYFGEPISKFLSLLRDDEWKSVRSILSTGFTSGKLKAMSKTMKPCAETILEHSRKIADNDEYFDVKSIFGSYTLDIIASCCFGVKTNVLNDPDHLLIKCFKEIFGLSKTAKFIIVLMSPKFAAKLQKWGLVEFVPSKPFHYLKTFTGEIIQRRKDKLEYRDDFLQMMIDHEEKPGDEEADTEFSGDLKTCELKKSLTDAEILAQAVLFLSAGYETTQSALTFIGYNLALYPDIQQKLIKEIDAAHEKYGEVNYEMIGEVPYLDMVINEALRMYPPATRIDRVAQEDYEYNGMKIPKGTCVLSSVWVMQHDPEFYPEPDKFIPERFSPENKAKRENTTFIAFGAGPRNCLGMRFAIIEMKILICEMLSNFEFTTCDKTPMKLTIDDSGFSRPKEQILLKLKPRY